MSQNSIPIAFSPKPILLLMTLLGIAMLACSDDPLRGVAPEQQPEGTSIDTADAVPGVEVTPLSYDFGTVPVPEMRANAFGVRNIGAVPFTLSATIENQTSVFTVELPADTSLEPGEVLVFVVKFSPAAEGSYSDRVALSFDVALESVYLPVQGAATACTDGDGDGYGQGCDLGDDCNDNDPAVHVSTTEVCDGVDNDCDGQIDEEFPEAGQPCDMGFGYCAEGTLACSPEGALTCTPPEIAPSLPCLLQCTINIQTGTSDCPSTFAVTWLSATRARATIPMDPDGDPQNGTTYSSLHLKFEVCDPSGFALNVGDSPSNNGGGGDGAERSNDAEVHLGNDTVGKETTLFMFGNDYSPAADKVILNYTGFVAATGCSTRSFWLADQRIVAEELCFEHQSPYLLRLYPPVDNEGPSDAEWYVGINGVIAPSSTRVGTGVQWVEVCLQ